MAHVFERGVDGKDEVELRIDQGAVEIEDQDADGREAAIAGGWFGQPVDLSENRVKLNLMFWRGVLGSNFGPKGPCFCWD